MTRGSNDKPNRNTICLREMLLASVQSPSFLPSLDCALWSVTPSLHPDSRSHTRATFLPSSCWEDVSLWLKALWEIPTARPFAANADHWGKVWARLTYTGQGTPLTSFASRTKILLTCHKQKINTVSIMFGIGSQCNPRCAKPQFTQRALGSNSILYDFKFCAAQNILS